MDKSLDLINWNVLKIKLKKKFPILTSADLEWRYTTQEDLLCTIANSLGKTKKELRQIIDAA